MRFIFADSHDYIDRDFNFVTEEHHAGRRAQHDDVYPHEYFTDGAPYDGMLVSRATVGDEKWAGKYSTTQSLRFRRQGAAKYLRYDAFVRRGGMLLGDCGAFSYVKSPMPLYSVDEMIEFYGECGFTHGVSVDHAILGYDEGTDTGTTLIAREPDPEWVRRFELTLRLAGEFHTRCDALRVPFTPIGVAQGWSPRSYAEAVQRLVHDLGYGYVALGGMVPLKTDQIHRCLKAVRTVAPDVKLHLFGFTKTDQIAEFVPYNLTSFDSTSPMLRAFKDSTKNYMTLDNGWYTAVRVPQADEFRAFKNDILSGAKNQRALRSLEAEALDALRRYSNDPTTDVETILKPVIAYDGERDADGVPASRVAAYRRTLTDRPWENCPCDVCQSAKIEVVLFRGSNRNRRRGFHNLWATQKRLASLRNPLAAL